MRNQKPVLLVDDDQVDAMMVRRAFKDAGVTNRLIHIDSGEEALKFLKDETTENPEHYSFEHEHAQDERH